MALRNAFDDLATSAKQDTGNASLANIDADLGSTADAAATSDSGTFSLLALFKRGLGNWTTLLARIPALVNGSISVTMNPTGPTVTTLTSIDNKTAALISGRSGVEPLGQPGVARQLTAGSASANTALTTTCRRISVFCRTADIRYSIGSTSQTASATTSHYIAAGERLDVAVPSTPNIAVIRAGSTDGTLEVTELV